MKFDISLREINFIVESLEVDYVRRVRKAQRLPGARNIKLTKELGERQALMQKVMTIRAKCYGAEEASDNAGPEALLGEKA